MRTCMCVCVCMPASMCAYLHLCVMHACERVCVAVCVHIVLHVPKHIHIVSKNYSQKANKLLSVIDRLFHCYQVACYDGGVSFSLNLRHQSRTLV